MKNKSFIHKQRDLNRKLPMLGRLFKHWGMLISLTWFPSEVHLLDNKKDQGSSGQGLS